MKYDREIAKLNMEKIRLELKLSARNQCSEEYHSTGIGANNAQMPDLTKGRRQVEKTGEGENYRRKEN